MTVVLIAHAKANPKMLKAFDLIREILFEQMQRETTLVQHFERAQARP